MFSFVWVFPFPLVFWLIVFVMKFPENFATTEFLNRLRKAHGVAGGGLPLFAWSLRLCARLRRDRREMELNGFVEPLAIGFLSSQYQVQGPYPSIAD
jgi:hypothetical protein